MQRIMSILAYLNILVIIPLIYILVSTKDDLVKAHTNNGIILGLTFWIFTLLAKWTAGINVVGDIFNIAQYVVWVFCTIFAIIGICYAVTGNKNTVPIIGKIKIIK